MILRAIIIGVIKMVIQLAVPLKARIRIIGYQIIRLTMISRFSLLMNNNSLECSEKI